MPLRDHFHAPLRDRRRWEGFHSDWASSIIRQLIPRLPARYFAEPHVHLGISVEADVATFQEEAGVPFEDGSGNGVATAVWAPAQATRTFTTDLPAQDLFEVRVHDEKRNSRLVAVVELVSPANKDREEHRQAFVAKCASYLQERIGLVVIDIVTERRQNLHGELMSLLQLPEEAPWCEEGDLYAIAYRTTKLAEQWHLETWNELLGIGRPLPTLPLWLASDLAVPLDIEASYEDTCRVLRIA